MEAQLVTPVESTLERIPLPVFVADREGNITSANSLFLSRFGESGTLANLFQADGPDLISAWRDCCMGGAAFSRTLIATDNGETFRIDAETPVNPQQSLLACAQSLREQQQIESRATAVLDAAVDAILIIDATGTILSINKAGLRLFGYTADELIGSDLTRLMPEPDRSDHQHYIERYLGTGEARIIGIGRELAAQNAAGQVFPIYLAVSEVEGAGSRCFAGIVRDLSEQRAQQAQLHEQQQRLAHIGRLTTMGEMTASIAHEINQPLTAIALYAQACQRLLGRDEDNTEKLRSALVKLNDQALRAGAVIERIQRFVRSQDEHREPTDINTLVQDLTHLAAGDARLHDVQIILKLKPHLPQTLCDPVQIQQVALNLIRNAIDAMHEINCRHGSTLIVATTQLDGGHIELSVTDQGEGVPAEAAGLVFTPFHTTKKDGMGMGLSICKSILSAHDGTLGYQNLEPHGARFALSLPVMRSAEIST